MLQHTAPAVNGTTARNSGETSCILISRRPGCSSRCSRWRRRRDRRDAQAVDAQLQPALRRRRRHVLGPRPEQRGRQKALYVRLPKPRRVPAAPRRQHSDLGAGAVPRLRRSTLDSRGRQGGHARPAGAARAEPRKAWVEQRPTVRTDAGRRQTERPALRRVGAQSIDDARHRKGHAEILDAQRREHRRAAEIRKQRRSKLPVPQPAQSQAARGSGRQ